MPIARKYIRVQCVLRGECGRDSLGHGSGRFGGRRVASFKRGLWAVHGRVIGPAVSAWFVPGRWCPTGAAFGRLDRIRRRIWPRRACLHVVDSSATRLALCGGGDVGSGIRFGGGDSVGYAWRGFWRQIVDCAGGRTARCAGSYLCHSVRMAVFTMLAVALYEVWNIPRGYWIAFTIMVVLQPDYGSTRQRAAARIGGTVGGIVLAGCLLELKLPLLALDAFAAAMAFVFAYFLKRRYWLAIFFVTINLVLITETMSPVLKNLRALRWREMLAGEQREVSAGHQGLDYRSRTTHR